MNYFNDKLEIATRDIECNGYSQELNPSEFMSCVILAVDSPDSLLFKDKKVPYRISNNLAYYVRAITIKGTSGLVTNEALDYYGLKFDNVFSSAVDHSASGGFQIANFASSNIVNNEERLYYGINVLGVLPYGSSVVYYKWMLDAIKNILNCDEFNFIFLHNNGIKCMPSFSKWALEEIRDFLVKNKGLENAKIYTSDGLSIY